MPKKSSQAVKTCKTISKGAIYLLVFLLPLFFLPWTANVLDFNKQILLIGLVLISLFAWWLRILIVGEFSFKLNRVHFAMGALFLVYLFSTLFSLWRYGSFWGWPLNTSESLLSLIGLILLYFLVVNIFSKKEIFYSLLLLVISGFLASLFGMAQLFGKFLFPFVFTKVVSFNTIGSVNSLSLFAAVLLPLTIILITNTRKFLRIVFILAAICSAILLILVNFSTAWWITMIGSALVIVFGTQRRDFFDNRWLILPMFFLALGLFFGFFRFQIPGLPDRPIEVYLDQRTSLDMSWETFKDRPILGSGPATFIYDFSRYKKPVLNQGQFWNVKFDAAGSKIINSWATTGILGIFSILALMGLFILEGIKGLFGLLNKGNQEENPSQKAEKGIDEAIWWNLSLGIFASFGALTVGYFLYGSNLTLDFLYFLLIAGFISLSSTKKRDFVLKPSSLLTLGVTFAFTLVFIFGFGLFILEGQRYKAEVDYLRGIRAWQEGRSDDSLGYLEKAVGTNSRVDLYWREISQVYLQKINEEARRTDLSQEEINQRVQSAINNTVSAAKNATDLNPKNVANWSVRGLVYQSLIGVVAGIKDWAIDAYTQASELEPANPHYPTQKGISLLREADSLPEERAQERGPLISQAREEFEKAIELKTDYAPARFQIAMVYWTEGRTEEAIQQLEDAKRLAPFDTGLAFQIGVLYYQNKDYEKAQVEFERAVGMDPNYSNALYYLGLTYDEQGKKSKAIEKFERVVQLNPNNREVQKVLGNLRAGRKALYGIIEEIPPEVPIEETPPEELEE